MKVKISVLVPIFVLILMISCSLAQTTLIPSSLAQTTSTPIYLGQTTWSLKITDHTLNESMIGKKLTLTGGITKVGDNYYLFQGTMMNGSDLSVLSGGGAMVNSKLILSLSETLEFESGDRSVSSSGDRVSVSSSGDRGSVSSSGDRSNSANGARSVGVMRLTLSDLDLDGIVTEVINQYTPGPLFGQGYFAGTLTRTGSVISLTPAAAAPTSLSP